MPRYVRYTVLGQHAWGRVEGDGVVAIKGDPFAPEAQSVEGPTLPWGAVVADPPVRPSKIVCIGRNYRAHAAELGNPVPERPLMFLKPPSCLVAHGGAIVYPPDSALVHHEGELAVIIGRRTRNVRAEDALAHVMGYTIFNDVTARDLQRADVQFTRGKGFDTFGPLGPWIDTDFVPADQRLTTTVNGELRQDGRLSDMIFDVATLIAFISRVMTLERFDVIATGTPQGVGPLEIGDTVSICIEGLGALDNHVVAASGE